VVKTFFGLFSATSACSAVKTMLSNDEKREIEQVIPHYAHKRSVGPEALRIVQRRRGWVSDELLADVAAFLEMTPAELDSVATLYNLIFRRPVGRHVILLCDCVSCWIMGYDRVLEHVTRRLGIGLGETTADGLFTLLPIACLGACDRAPAMMIDEELYVDLDRDRIDEILSKYSGKPA